LQAKTRPAAEVDALESGFARLVAGTQHHAQGMGETYKFMALAPSGVPTLFPFDIDFAAVHQG
jgi:hypothetical protein